MLARAPLPKAVNAVGDRIGLNYKIDRKGATREYVDTNQKASRLEYGQLKNTYYSLNESKTKKSETISKKKLNIVNPLKLSSRIRKSLYKLSAEEKSQLRYSTFLEIHQLWQQYAKKVVDDIDPMGVFRMDLHGACLKCVASKNPSLIGIEGIVVQETKRTFFIIKETNRLMTVPKQESIFHFSVGQKLYQIHGCNLMFTTQTRSKVKYKQKKCLPVDQV